MEKRRGRWKKHRLNLNFSNAYHCQPATQSMAYHAGSVTNQGLPANHNQRPRLGRKRLSVTNQGLPANHNHPVLLAILFFSVTNQGLPANHNLVDGWWQERGQCNQPRSTCKSQLRWWQERSHIKCNQPRSTCKSQLLACRYQHPTQCNQPRSTCKSQPWGNCLGLSGTLISVTNQGLPVSHNVLLGIRTFESIRLALIN